MIGFVSSLLTHLFQLETGDGDYILVDGPFHSGVDFRVFLESFDEFPCFDVSIGVELEEMVSLRENAKSAAITQGHLQTLSGMFRSQLVALLDSFAGAG